MDRIIRILFALFIISSVTVITYILTADIAKFDLSFYIRLLIIPAVLGIATIVIQIIEIKQINRSSRWSEAAIKAYRKVLDWDGKSNLTIEIPYKIVKRKKK